jgi:hypothetical protein
MSASGIRILPNYQNRRYLTPELEALNRDFEYSYTAGGIITAPEDREK